MIPIIKPVGIGDLKVVKQKLARYEPGEIAHIENVLRSEHRLRTHRRLRQVEEILTVEEERLEESLRDLQSTERFEMQNEVESVIRSESKFQAGIDASASYGPVTVSAYAKYDSSNAKEESEKNATKYAKDVTEKALSRLVEKIRRERRNRTLEETEETNSHEFDNKEGDGNISGVYRWVDKYYRSKVVDYGKRLMYEFIVPEPAAFYVFATQYNLDHKVLPTKPERPTVPGSSTPLGPGDINRDNYRILIGEYDVHDAQPPPPRWIVVTKALHRDIPNSEPWAFSTDEFKVPKGYKADHFNIAMHLVSAENGEGRGDIQIGTVQVFFSGNFPELVLRGEQGSIPISAVGQNIRTIAINIEATCRLSGAEFQKWQLATYTAIMNAYMKALTDFEERVAAAQISQGVAIGRENPAINREIEKRELKRSCLTMWAGLTFDHPEAIEQNLGAEVPVPDNYPRIHLENAIALSTDIEFFEKAFEWTNMTYDFLPYAWGRKPRWVDLLNLQSTDPVFEQFLQAGAARVLVPVTPSYTEAVLFYQVTGTIWTGGEIAPFEEDDDPDARLYNGYIAEMADVADLPDIDREVEISPEDTTTFPTKVPTTLVWLQPNSTLPDFEAEV